MILDIFLILVLVFLIITYEFKFKLLNKRVEKNEETAQTKQVSNKISISNFSRSLDRLEKEIENVKCEHFYYVEIDGIPIYHFKNDDPTKPGKRYINPGDKPKLFNRKNAQIIAELNGGVVKDIRE